LIFFVYPNPKGSEENQFAPLGAGVTKLIFERTRKVLLILIRFNMKTYKSNKRDPIRLLYILFLIISPLQLASAQQKIGFGIHASPIISWFSTDISQIRNNGARPGFNFGLTYSKYFAANYSFTSGINLLNTSGRLISNDTSYINISGIKSKVLPGKPVVYKIQYLTFPIGLKLQTNQIGYITFFSDLGLVPKVVINRKLDIPSLSMSRVNGSDEIRLFNLSYHVTAGIEYSLGGTTALVFGLDYDNNFLDITKDTGTKRADRVSQKILSFRFGVNF
jgi:hypothetical protein